MPHRARGAALLTALMMIGLLTAIVVAVLVYVHEQRLRNIDVSRAIVRDTCAATGMQHARAYFGRRMRQWDAFLARPANYSDASPHLYNPVKSSWNPYPVNIASSEGRALVKKAHPELLVDLDGDGREDVYLYLRDNADELLPAPIDWARDNDQLVIVGAICISSTMAPHRRDGTVAPELITVEGLLACNLNTAYAAEQLGSSAGTGNLNPSVSCGGL